MKKKIYILKLTCPDARGIVAAVSSALHACGGNIVHADEHVDLETNLFLMRVEYALKDTAQEDEFARLMHDIGIACSMQWSISDNTTHPRVALLVSKQLHCLSDLLFRYKEGELQCEVVCIISNHPDAGRLAQFYSIPFFHITGDKPHMEKNITELCKKQTVRLAILARYMQILSSEFIDGCGMELINIHHSFLPAFVGAKPYHQAYERGVKLIGATGHYVTSELDAGPIITQDVAHISHRDTVPDLIKKGRDLEKIVLARAVALHLAHKVLRYGNKTVVFT
jgi:formyltetrahydrofolate deformylase